MVMEVARSEEDAELRQRAIFWLGESNDPRVPASDPRRFAYVLDKLGKQAFGRNADDLGELLNRYI